MPVHPNGHAARRLFGEAAEIRYAPRIRTYEARSRPDGDYRASLRVRPDRDHRPDHDHRLDHDHRFHPMTARERRAFLVSAVILFVASGVRWVHDTRAREPLFPPDSAGIRDELLAETRELMAEEERRSRPLEEGERLDPNRAPAVELDRLPGVGPATADRIVAERSANGGFRAPADLERVRGIGPATVARMEPYLDFERPPPAVTRPVATRPVAERPIATRPVTTRPADPRPITEPPPAGDRRPTSSGSTGSVAARPETAAPVLDLNTASAAELESLRGVGPVLAERIVAFRTEHGPFGSVDALVEVRGVGPATLESLRPFLRAGSRSPR